MLLYHRNDDCVPRQVCNFRAPLDRFRRIFLASEPRVEFGMRKYRCGVLRHESDDDLWMSRVNALLLLRLIVSRSVVTRSLVTWSVVVVVAGSGVPRLVAMLVGAILGVVLGVISIIPGFAAIAAGKTN